MANCPKCNKNVGDANYCPNCGTKIPKVSDPELDKKIDAFFDALENASQEDRDAFFKMLEEDLKKKKGGK